MSGNERIPGADLDPTTRKALFELRERRDGQALKTIGIVLKDAGPGWAEGELEITKKHINPIGSVHGGIVFMLADAIGGSGACTRGKIVTSSSGSISFLNPALGVKKLYARADELKSGKNLLTFEVTITSDTGRLIAKAIMEYFSLHVDMGNYDDLIEKGQRVNQEYLDSLKE